MLKLNVYLRICCGGDSSWVGFSRHGEKSKASDVERSERRERSRLIYWNWLGSMIWWKPTYYWCVAPEQKLEWCRPHCCHVIKLTSLIAPEKTAQDGPFSFPKSLTKSGLYPRQKEILYFMADSVENDTLSPSTRKEDSEGLDTLPLASSNSWISHRTEWIWGVSLMLGPEIWGGSLRSGQS